MSRFVVGIAILSLASTAVAADETKKIAGVKFAVTKGWSVKEEKAEGITLLVKDGTATAVVIDLKDIPKDELAKGKKNPKEILSKLGVFEKIDVSDKPSTEKAEDGLKFTTSYGTSKVKDAGDKTFDWAVMITEGGKSPVLVLVFGDLTKYEKQVEEFLDTFEKAD
jgi:hypothetical protein